MRCKPGTLRYAILLLTWMASSSHAAEFSAGWVEYDGQKERVIGRIHRRDQALRLEFSTADAPQDTWALIADLARARSVAVDGDGRYRGEQPLPPMFSQAWPPREPPEVRCQDPAWRCLRVDEPSRSNDEPRQWRLQSYDNGRWRDSLVWVRAADSLVVREQWPDGRSIQLLETARVDHQGRETHRHHYLTTAADGTRWHSRFWYDAALRQVVREDLPDGSSRWMDRISVGAQPENLFVLPGGSLSVQSEPVSGTMQAPPPPHYPVERPE